MTPKEKAKELWNNIIDPIYGGDGGLPYFLAKETIIKCVDEIIKANPAQVDGWGRAIGNIKFWQQVKEELKNL